MNVAPANGLGAVKAKGGGVEKDGSAPGVADVCGCNDEGSVTAPWLGAVIAGDVFMIAGVVVVTAGGVKAGCTVVGIAVKLGELALLASAVAAALAISACVPVP